MTKTGNELMWNNFIRLGEMIGDGDHEPWVEKEYKRLLKILCPPTEEQKAAKKEIRQKRNKMIDTLIAERLEKDKCNVCTGNLTQTRSGSKVVECIPCKRKYTYTTKKKKK